MFDHIGGINTMLHTLFNNGQVVVPSKRTAEAVVAEEQLMAVVEPLLPALTPDEIRSEIAAAQIAAEDEAARVDQADLYGDFEDVIDEELERAAEQEPAPEPMTAPSRDEVRAGLARIAALLTSKDA